LFHDKSVRKSAAAAPRLFRVRDGIFMRPVRYLLVHRGNREAADAGRRRRLPVPRLSAEDGDANCEHRDKLTDRWTIKAVLLDMDGTLLDTEKLFMESLIAAMGAFGYTDDIAALCHAMVGLTGPQCDTMLLDRYGATFPIADLNEAFRANRDNLIEAGIPLKPGATDLMDAVQQHGYPMAIVTSATRRGAENQLTLAGIRQRFDTVITRSDVAHAKPSPDLYLLAAERLGVPAPFCLAIEDSNPGVAAAHAAGAITIMVPDIVPPTDASRAKCIAVLPDLGAVLAMLREPGELSLPSSLGAR
jgi:HAD superfamily hydrolase (TIGR01509 family)